MKKFNNVIVRRPCRAVCDGITSAPELGQPIYEKALQQHDTYIEALKKCGVEVTVLEADERYPDSCFVEDPALITRACAIITNPGAESRNGEKDEIIGAIRKFFPEDKIEYIKDPGTLEGGDVMMVDDTFYVGLSARTNEEGIRQLTEILANQKEYWEGRMPEEEFRRIIGSPTDVSPLPNVQMLIFENNYANNHSDTNKRLKGMADTEFNWGFQWHMDQSCMDYLDIVLPGQVLMFETRDTYMLGSERFMYGPNGMRNYFMYADKICDPPGEVRSRDWFYTQLAKRLGIGEKFNPRMVDVTRPVVFATPKGNFTVTVAADPAVMEASLREVCDPFLAWVQEVSYQQLLSSEVSSKEPEGDDAQPAAEPESAPANDNVEPAATPVREVVQSASAPAAASANSTARPSSTASTSSRLADTGDAAMPASLIAAAGLVAIASSLCRRIIWGGRGDV